MAKQWFSPAQRATADKGVRHPQAVALEMCTFKRKQLNGVLSSVVRHQLQIQTDGASEHVMCCTTRAAAPFKAFPTAAGINENKTRKFSPEQQSNLHELNCSLCIKWNLRQSGDICYFIPGSQQQQQPLNSEKTLRTANSIYLDEKYQVTTQTCCFCSCKCVHFLLFF